MISDSVVQKLCDKFPNIAPDVIAEVASVVWDAINSMHSMDSVDILTEDFIRKHTNFETVNDFIVTAAAEKVANDLSRVIRIDMPM